MQLHNLRHNMSLNFKLTQLLIIHIIKHTKQHLSRWCGVTYFDLYMLHYQIINCNQWSCSVRCLNIHLQEQVHVTDLKTYMEKLLQNYWCLNMIIVRYRTAVIYNNTGLHTITKLFITYTLCTVSVRITICILTSYMFCSLHIQHLLVQRDSAILLWHDFSYSDNSVQLCLSGALNGPTAKQKLWLPVVIYNWASQIL